MNKNSTFNKIKFSIKNIFTGTKKIENKMNGKTISYIKERDKKDNIQKTKGL